MHNTRKLLNVKREYHKCVSCPSRQPVHSIAQDAHYGNCLRTVQLDLHPRRVHPLCAIGAGHVRRVVVPARLALGR